MRQQGLAVLAIAVMGIACAGGGPARGASPAGAPAAAPPTTSAVAGPGASSPPAQASRPAAQAPTPMQAAFSAFSMSQSPLAIAKEGGYFAEEGLDVTVSHVPSASQTAAALLSGEMDVVTTGGVGVIRARLAGSDLVLVGGTKPYFAGSIVVRPEITTAADLRGKRIGITNKGSNTDLMARAVLPRLGLEPDRDVVLFATGNDLQTVSALIAGNVEAGSMTPPSDERAKNEGMHYLADVTAMKIAYPATALGTSGATVTNRGDVLERYLRAYAKAVHRYVTDKEFTLGVAAEFLRSEDRVANELAYEIERGHMQVDLSLPLDAVRGTLELIKDEEPRAASARPEEFVDFRVLDRIKQSGFFDRLVADQSAR
jgi:NitT/TauT family transport system substrate-binding protein